METSLHRQLKTLYAKNTGTEEIRVEAFRIDVVRDTLLIEIQHGSLSAIRRKLEHLLATHRVLVVKPIVVRKYVVQCAGPGRSELGRRLSPKRGSLLSLFDELVYLTRVFPHPNLTLDVLLVDIEEWRFPGHGRRRRWRRRDFQIVDQKLTGLHGVERFREAQDLLRLMPDNLTGPFHTGHLAEQLNIRRDVAQRMAYCLKNSGAVRSAGKAGNAHLYEVVPMA